MLWTILKNRLADWGWVQSREEHVQLGMYCIFCVCGTSRWNNFKDYWAYRTRTRGRGLDVKRW